MEPLAMNGPGEMGNDFFKHSTLDGVVAIVGSETTVTDGTETRTEASWLVATNSGRDAARFTPLETMDIAWETNNPYEPCAGTGEDRDGLHYDVQYVGQYRTFKEAYEAACEAYPDALQEQHYHLTKEQQK